MLLGDIEEEFAAGWRNLDLIAHLNRIMQPIEYITSNKGKGGGIELKQEAHYLKLGDLVQKLEPNMHLVECFDRERNTCKAVSSCQLKHYILEANQSFIYTLNHYSLADAIKDKHLFLRRDT